MKISWLKNTVFVQKCLVCIPPSLNKKIIITMMDSIKGCFKMYNVDGNETLGN